LVQLVTKLTLVFFCLDMRGRFWTVLLDIRLTLGPFSGGLFSPLHALLSQLLLDSGRCSCLCSPFLGKSRVGVKLGILDGERLVLVHPHLPEGKGHALLHVRPLLILLLQHVASEQWGGGGWGGLRCIVKSTYS